MILRTRVDSPLGAFTLYSDGAGLVRVVLPGTALRHEETSVRRGHGEIRDGDDEVLAAARRQLAEYFAGDRREFELPLAGAGTTFQRAVWHALSDIPYGETRSYADIAVCVGRPGAARAVGQANRRNPLPVFVPCHRVIAADGALGGYQGQWNADGGLKARLLAHERVRP
jgi:methylated-DNA-[protein]-cysteine S-methyltransferase